MSVNTTQVRANDIPADQIRAFGNANAWVGGDRPFRGRIDGELVKGFGFKLGNLQESWDACLEEDPACLAEAVRVITRRLEFMFLGKPVTLPAQRGELPQLPGWARAYYYG